MAYTTLNLGLTLTIPTVGTRNWGQTMFQTTWTKISQHGHTGSGDGNQIGTSGFADFSITRDKLKKNLGVYPYGTVISPGGSSATADFNNGSIQKIDLETASADLDLTLANPVAGVVYKLLIYQGSTPRDINWPASVKWPQGQKPILSQTNNAIDKVELYYDGTNYFGDWQNDYQ